MYSIKSVAFALSALALAGTSQAWLIEFWQGQELTGATSCAQPFNTPEKVGGEVRMNQKCHMVTNDFSTMRVKDWDPGCRVMLWGQYQYGCGDSHDAPFFNMTAAEAAKLNYDHDKVLTGKKATCFEKVGEGHRHVYVSYTCPPAGKDNGNNGDDRI